MWATVPRICLFEKGYGEDEFVLQEVDICKSFAMHLAAGCSLPLPYEILYSPLPSWTTTDLIDDHL